MPEIAPAAEAAGGDVITQQRGAAPASAADPLPPAAGVADESVPGVATGDGEYEYYSYEYYSYSEGERVPMWWASNCSWWI